MDDQVKSQALGLSLAVATAVGCLAYERLVKALSFPAMALVCCGSYLAPTLLSLYWVRPTAQDWIRLWDHRFTLLVYCLSAVTVPLWYCITRKQSVMVGSVYEVKYIVILGLFYACFGTGRITLNTVLGAGCALLSIYFISKG